MAHSHIGPHPRSHSVDTTGTCLNPTSLFKSCDDHLSNRNPRVAKFCLRMGGPPIQIFTILDVEVHICAQIILQQKPNPAIMEDIIALSEEDPNKLKALSIE